MLKTVLTMTMGVVATMFAAGTGGAAAEPAPPANQPTVVLVHGAFADSSSWNGVVSKLEADGYPVLAVANPLRGLASDADYVRSVVAGVPGPVVLAGHSYGGSVMSQAADGLPNVKALVYVASFILEPGRAPANWPPSIPVPSSGPHSTACPSCCLAAAKAPTSTSGRTSSSACSLPTFPPTSPHRWLRPSGRSRRQRSKNLPPRRPGRPFRPGT